ncbi:MAG TPA: Txe/YoeB family addiction module toxin [Flavobacteriales bacterium]|nr:Txe/YoeB family addiction module toxin [Flavobacteriales bacterium]HNU55816.1 Txe/YoeB family addiction module toxin [Flavobacteriales bacterium]
MTVEFTGKGWEDFCYWLENDPKKAVRIRELIKECLRTPFTGTGKPEALKFALKGFWSRRIDDEHRLVYTVSGSGNARSISIVQCRFHYN